MTTPVPSEDLSNRVDQLTSRIDVLEALLIVSPNKIDPPPRGPGTRFDKIEKDIDDLYERMAKQIIVQQIALNDAIRIIGKYQQNIPGPGDDSTTPS